MLAECIESNVDPVIIAFESQCLHNRAPAGVYGFYRQLCNQTFTFFVTKMLLLLHNCHMLKIKHLINIKLYVMPL